MKQGMKMIHWSHMIKILGILLISVSLMGIEKDLEFEHIGVREGLSQSTIFYIFQDSKGFMWFGTGAGLNKYDGSKITIYKNSDKNPNSLSDDYVLFISEDKDGQLWIGTVGGGLNRFDPLTETFTCYKHKLPAGNPLRANSTCYNLDHQGSIWMGTLGDGLNRFDPETETFTYYRHDPGNPKGLSSNNITSICSSREGFLWIGTQGGGLNRLDPKNDTFTSYQYNTGNNLSMTRNFIAAICQDREGILWMTISGRGLYQFNPQAGSFPGFPVSYPSKPGSPGELLPFDIVNIYEDHSGILWFSTVREGLICFDLQTDTFEHFLHDPNNPNSLSDGAIVCTYQTPAGILWVGTGTKGVDKLYRKKRKFNHYRHDPNNLNSLRYNSISALYEDREGILWIGNFVEGLDKYDSKKGTFSHYLPPTDPPLGLNSVTALWGDESGILWIGLYSGGLYRFDPQKETFSRSFFDPQKPGSQDYIIISFAEDQPGFLWCGTFGGLCRIDIKSGKFTRYNHRPGDPSSLSHNVVSILYQDRAGVPWIGTNGGGLNKFNREKQTFHQYRVEIGNPNSLSDNDILCILEDQAGYLWIGTEGGGLNRFDREKESFRQYSTKEGLPDDIINGVLEDREGCLWISTNRGLSRFCPNTGEFRNYDLSSGLQHYEFNAKAYFKRRNGEMLFGGVNGINAFFPEKIEDNPHIPPVVITDFKIFNQTVNIGGDSPLKKHINFTEQVTLSSKENMISLEFAALDYANPAKNQYKYKIEGLHDDWILLGYKHDITITGLEPGEYLLRVKGSNNDGVWNEEGTSLMITITPPFWATWWFQLLVALLAAALLYAWHRSRLKRVILKAKTETEMDRIFKKYNISSREQEIIQLILKGKSNKEIENLLFISMPTVRTHIYNCYKKLGVKNRLELINLFQRSIKDH